MFKALFGSATVFVIPGFAMVASFIGFIALSGPVLADHEVGHDEVARGGILANEQRIWDLEQALQLLPGAPGVRSVDCASGELIQDAVDDAVRDLKTVRDEWLATALRFGHYIPEPKLHLEFEVFMAPTASPCPAYKGNSDVETGIGSVQTVWIQHEGG